MVLLPCSWPQLCISEGLENMASANSDKERKARPEIGGIQSLSPQEGGQFLLLNLKSWLVGRMLSPYQFSVFMFQLLADL